MPINVGGGYRINRAAARCAAYAGGQCYGCYAHSPFFYNRVRGDEEALIAQNWPKLTIARPSMLLGDRSKQRMNETLFAPLFRLLPGNWKSIDARDVARVMLAEAMRPGA